MKGMAPFVVGVGPGFRAPDLVDVVIESNRGHDLGRVIYEGEAEAIYGSSRHDVGIYEGTGPQIASRGDGAAGQEHSARG